MKEKLLSQLSLANLLDIIDEGGIEITPKEARAAIEKRFGHASPEPIQPKQKRGRPKKVAGKVTVFPKPASKRGKWKRTPAQRLEQKARMEEFWRNKKKNK